MDKVLSIRFFCSKKNILNYRENKKKIEENQRKKIKNSLSSRDLCVSDSVLMKYLMYVYKVLWKNEIIWFNILVLELRERLAEENMEKKFK